MNYQAWILKNRWPLILWCLALIPTLGNILGNPSSLPYFFQLGGLVLMGPLILLLLDEWIPWPKSRALSTVLIAWFSQIGLYGEPLRIWGTVLGLLVLVILQREEKREDSSFYPWLLFLTPLAWLYPVLALVFAFFGLLLMTEPKKESGWLIFGAAFLPLLYRFTTTNSSLLFSGPQMLPELLRSDSLLPALFLIAGLAGAFYKGVSLLSRFLLAFIPASFASLLMGFGPATTPGVRILIFTLVLGLSLKADLRFRFRKLPLLERCLTLLCLLGAMSPFLS